MGETGHQETRAGVRRGRAPRSKARNRWLPWLALTASGLGIGLWRSVAGQATHPVRGWVLVGGEPAAGARVEFHAEGGWPLGWERPTGRVREDGSFDLEAGLGRAGAVAGGYIVTVEWREALRVAGESVTGPSLVPDDYTRPADSPLRATVVEGENLLPPFWIERRYP